MNIDENNCYIHTMQPILFLMRITGLIPVSLKMKNTQIYDFISKIATMLGLSVFTLNFVNTTNLMYQDYILCFRHNFDGKMILALAPVSLLRTTIFIVPITVWKNLQNLQNHWIRWKFFQDEYKIILNLDSFESKFRKKVNRIAGESFACVIITELLIQMRTSYQDDHRRLISDALNISFLYFMIAYWVSNCFYVRLIGIEMNKKTKECIKNGKCNRRLRKFTMLWLSLHDLLEEFVSVHASLFLAAFMEIIVGVICIAYLNLSSNPYSKFFDRGVAFDFCIITFAIMFIVCESAHYVHKQVYFKQKEMLLQKNTWNMNTAILQSVSRFLDTILVKNPSINIGGFMPIDRSFFLYTVAIVVNYMIVLRQFQS